MLLHACIRVTRRIRDVRVCVVRQHHHLKSIDCSDKPMVTTSPVNSTRYDSVTIPLIPGDTMSQRVCQAGSYKLRVVLADGLDLQRHGAG